MLQYFTIRSLIIASLIIAMIGCAPRHSDPTADLDSSIAELNSENNNTVKNLSQNEITLPDLEGAAPDFIADDELSESSALTSNTYWSSNPLLDKGRYLVPETSDFADETDFEEAIAPAYSDEINAEEATAGPDFSDKVIPAPQEIEEVEEVTPPDLIEQPQEALVPPVITGEEIPGEAPSPDYRFDFRVTAKLKNQVDFWTAVYGIYDSKQVIIHDKENLGIIYEVVDFNRERNGGKKCSSDATKKKYRQILLKLDNPNLDLNSLNEDEIRVYNMFAEVPGKNKFRKAATSERLRAQRGQKNSFRQAIIRSGLYMDRAEEIFISHGLPKELCRLPFVESYFNPYARSSCNALGMWQFMPYTGKLFMKINKYVDERRDPFLATHAAAKLLKANYDMLGTWPLALTAYNHGAMGVARGLKKTQTETLEELIENYNHPQFGFASKNFYAEFLAALEVSTNYKKYFGDLELEPPLQYETVELLRDTGAGTIIKYCNLSKDDFRRLNPGLSDSVLKGYNYIPKNYPLRIPAGSKDRFMSAYNSLFKDQTKFVALIESGKHKVKSGETLSRIADRYNVSIKKLIAANNLSDPHSLQVGYLLNIPGKMAAPAETVDQKSEPKVTTASLKHKVRSGENLSLIAKKYSTDVETLAELNKLGKKGLIKAGQTLKIPGAVEVAFTKLDAPKEAAPKNVEEKPLEKIPAITVASVSSPVAQAEPEAEIEEDAPEEVEPVPQEEIIGEDVKAKPDKKSAKSVELADKTEKGNNSKSAKSKKSDDDEEKEVLLGKVTVASRETLNLYAQWTGMSANSLRRLNKLKKKQKLQVGQKLLVDFSQISKTEFEKNRKEFHAALEQKYLRQFKVAKVLTHTLKPRQNVWYLCKYVYNVPLWLVKKYNEDKNLESMRAGDELKIPVLKEM